MLIDLEQPIRIAMIMGKMIGGGVESVVMNYYRHIDRTKVQFDFIIDEDSTVIPFAEIKKLGGRVYKIAPYQNLKKYMQDLEQLIVDNNYLIVHSHINTLSVFPLLIAKKCNVPIRIAHSHSTAASGELKKNFVKYFLRLFSKLCPTHFFAPTQHAGEWLFGKKIGSEKLIILKNAIEVQKFSFDEEKRTYIRNKLSMDTNEFIIGNIGRLVWQKNQTYLLKVFAEFHEKVSNSKLLIIGDGPLKNELQELAKKLDIINSIIFLDNADNVEDYYQAMDCFVFPSNYEGLGMVAIEAQCSGLNTICSNNVPTDVKVTELCSFLDINSECVSEWSEKLYDIYTKQTNVIRESKARQLNESNYNIIEESEKLVGFYVELTKTIISSRHVV